MEDLNINVIKGFKIKAKSIKKEKLSYIINADSGIKVIKKTSASSKSLIFQNEIKNFLYENGFKSTDIFHMSAQGKPFFEFNNENYVMTDYIDSKNIDFSVNDEFKRALVALGGMHSILKKIELKEDIKLYRNISLQESYAKNINEFHSLIKRVKKQNKLSDFDVVFLKNYSYYMDNLKKSMELFDRLNFNLMSEEARKNNEICHNLVKEGCLFFNPGQKEVVITNFSECLIDISIIDLADIIKRYIKSIGQNPMTMAEIISAYTSENKLSDEEIKLIYPLLLYPSKFIKICTQYYAKKRTWVPGAINSRMNFLIEKKDIEKEFIEEFYKYSG